MANGTSLLLLGARRAAAMAPGSAAFGFAFGTLFSHDPSGWWVATFASAILFAGAAQFAIVEQLGNAAPVAIAVATALLINLRLALYSFALGPLWAQQPLRWKLGLGFMITDQSAIVALSDEVPRPARDRRLIDLGTALTLNVPWVLGTAIGAITGGRIPHVRELGFVVPLVFISMLIPSLKARAAVVAAVTAAIVVVALKDLPGGVNLLIAILVGVGAGSAVHGPGAETPPVKQPAPDE